MHERDARMIDGSYGLEMFSKKTRNDATRLRWLRCNLTTGNHSRCYAFCFTSSFYILYAFAFESLPNFPARHPESNSYCQEETEINK